VDHDHSTGAVRGLLCYFCNVSIGTFEFNKATAWRASEYLARIADASPAVVVETVGSADTRVPGDLPF
jgi:hypothetical protein